MQDDRSFCTPQRCSVAAGDSDGRPAGGGKDDCLRQARAVPQEAGSQGPAGSDRCLQVLVLMYARVGADVHRNGNDTRGHRTPSALSVCSWMDGMCPAHKQYSWMVMFALDDSSSNQPGIGWSRCNASGQGRVWGLGFRVQANPSSLLQAGSHRAAAPRGQESRGHRV